MGYRMHFYLLGKDDIQTIETAESNGFLEVDDKEVLCLEMQPDIARIWDKARPLFKKGTEGYRKYGNKEEENPCIITKKLLREIVLAFHKVYQNYIVHNSIYLLPHEDPTKLKPTELFNRCMHLGTGDIERDKKDDDCGRLWGQYILHQQFLIHCSVEGEDVERGQKDFEKYLDNQLIMTTGNTMYDILMQLVYLYKTFKPSKKLVICGW